MNNVITNRRSLTAIYSIHQCLYWIVVCCTVSFAATYMTAKGLDVSAVGFVLFGANILSFAVQLFLASIADKSGDSRALKLLMIILSGIPLIIMLVLCFTDIPLWLLAVLYVPMAAGIDMEMPLMNSIVVFYSKRSYTVSYSIARSIAAAAFGLSSLGMGYAMKILGCDVSLLAALVSTAAYTAITLLYPREGMLASRAAGPSGIAGAHGDASDGPADRPDQAVQQADLSGIAITDTSITPAEHQSDTHQCRPASDHVLTGAESGTGSLSLICFIRKYKWYVLSVGAVMLFGASHVASENYLIEIVRPLGGDSSNVGVALLVCTMAEIPGTLIASRLYKKLQARRIWLLIGISYTIRMLFYVLAGSVGMIYLGQVFQCCSYALLPPSQLYYARDCVDDRDMVKGQSTSTALYSLGNALGNLFGGLAVSAAGVAAMLKGCVGGALLGLLIAAVFVPFALKAAKKTAAPAYR